MRVSNLGLYRKTYRNKGQIWRKLQSTVTNTTDLKGGIASEPRDPESHELLEPRKTPTGVHRYYASCSNPPKVLSGRNISF